MSKIAPIIQSGQSDFGLFLKPSLNSRRREILAEEIFHQHPAGPTAVDLFAEFDLDPYRAVCEALNFAGVGIPVGVRHGGGKDLRPAGRVADV